MNIRTISRATIDGTLRLIRLPFDAAVALLPESGHGSKPAKVRLDVADARIRAAAGTLIGDPELRHDARRRLDAARERQAASALRDRAERTVDDAETRTEQRRQQASARKQRADERAAATRRQADERAKATKRQAAEEEQSRKEAIERAAENREERAESEANRDRLAVVSAKSQALDEREDALTAADEAQRLGDAAARAKAERKRGRRG